MDRVPFMRLAGTVDSVALLVMRVVGGVAFMFHGWPKIQNPTAWMGEEAGVPGFMQALAAAAEFFGGLAWILGLLTPLASLGILCTMAVAVWTHVDRGDPFVGSGASYELALLYFTLALLLILVGPGRYSLDALLFRRLRRARVETRVSEAAAAEKPPAG